jgi:hypothetical protein
MWAVVTGSAATTADVPVFTLDSCKVNSDGRACVGCGRVVCDCSLAVAATVATATATATPVPRGVATATATASAVSATATAMTTTPTTTYCVDAAD